MAKLSIRDLDLKGKRVFIRVDFNVPLANAGQEITSDKRIRASLPTIQVRARTRRGRHPRLPPRPPQRQAEPEMSMKPVAARLQELLGKPVKTGAGLRRARSGSMLPAPGEVLLLENLRFHAEEESERSRVLEQLAKLCDVYVNDAFGSAHRAHASTVGMIAVRAAGGRRPADGQGAGIPRRMVTTNPARPCVAILGGAKVSDKIEVIENLAQGRGQSCSSAAPWRTRS